MKDNEQDTRDRKSEREGGEDAMPRGIIDRVEIILASHEDPKAHDRDSLTASSPLYKWETEARSRDLTRPSSPR